MAHALANDKLEDWAYGGSTVNNSRVQGFSGALMTLAVPSVLENIQEYLDRNPQLDPNALFVVTGTPNILHLETLPQIKKCVYVY